MAASATADPTTDATARCFVIESVLYLANNVAKDSLDINIGAAISFILDIDNDFID